jgi:WD40 repeat protein
MCARAADIIISILKYIITTKIGSENGRVSVWSYTGKLIHTWQAHGSSGVKAVKMSGNQDLVLSGADDVCVYSTKYQRCQITCWNGSVVTSVEWVNDKTFLIAEASGMITLDKAYPDNFRKVSY